MWYKSWVEVRWRLVLMTLLNAFFGAVLLDDAVSADVWRHRLSGNLPMIFAMNAIVLAGSGVASQLSQRPGQLVHPSMMFLLSLPITRSRLVLVRQAVGAMSVCALMLATTIVFCAVAPGIREIFSPASALLFLICIAGVVFTVYAISALLSTVLDQLWQTYGALAIVAGIFGAFPRARFWSILLEQFNATNVPPTVWTQVFIGLLTCAALTFSLVFASVRVVQRKQF
ncbi:MAG: hypothetical protein ABI852_04050 [Gemmatimonadaceae bacterium]